MKPDGFRFVDCAPAHGMPEIESRVHTKLSADARKLAWPVLQSHCGTWRDRCCPLSCWQESNEPRHVIVIASVGEPRAVAAASGGRARYSSLVPVRLDLVLRQHLAVVWLPPCV